MKKEAIKKRKRITNKVRVFRALINIGKGGTFSYKKLASRLKIQENTFRTLMWHLRKEGVISCKNIKRGQTKLIKLPKF